jgi:hypothetical protein
MSGLGASRPAVEASSLDVPEAIEAERASGFSAKLALLVDGDGCTLEIGLSFIQ